MKHLFFHVSFLWLVTLSFGSLAQSNAQIDSLDMEAFMDGLMHNMLDERKVAGATVSIVKDGRLLLLKGYGVSDVELQKPVEPERTLFRIGSITKLFVWTAVMQLHSQGKLDLDADINVYLDDFEVPEKFGQPITLKNLLSHTPGFEDHVLELFVNDESKLLPLGEILKKEMPERVRPPYSQASYSNHGSGIAAYIVEKVSGMSFHDYTQQNILDPLGMNATTMRQPLPENMQEHMSKGYVFNKRFEEKDFELVPLYPVGAATSTSSDMALLMLAYLQQGHFEGYTLLDSATFISMLQPLHHHHPEVNPLLYGFMDLSQKGTMVYGHGGDTFWFHSLMALVPEHDFGLFISFNTGNVMNGYIKVMEAIMDRYFPDPRPLAPPVEVNRDGLQKFAGEYKVNRYNYNDLTKIVSLMSRVQVTVEEDGKIAVHQPGDSKYYVPLANHTFREIHNNNRIAFGENEQGEIHYLFDGILSIYALEKVSLIELSQIHISILVMALLTAILVLVYWPLAARIRRNHQSLHSHKKLIPVVGKWVAWLNYACYLVFLVGIGLILSDPFELVYGIPISLKLLLFLPIFMVVFTFLMLFFTIRYLGDRDYTALSKAFFLLLTLISFAAIWQLYFWNFLGWQY
ncbi:serine hydrolase domain-containing protein [Pararhodonellum marinum]|uniref:serine hydrolase domain-containing protein n=1 Tax=Pararhodonellum marinum TaxID=2755358 RepID=UPI00188DF0C7|nr:serine hydrolase domain-containing protein [Pararhodonellum marinum]